MKKGITFILLSITFIIFTLLFLEYDRKCFNYGFDCNFCNKVIPYYLKPSADRYYNFYLMDEDNYELVGRGFRYETTNFQINKFLSYGYNDTSVIIKCTDSMNNIKYLVSYETGYKSKKGNPEISFKDLKNSEFDQVKEKYQWFEIDEEKAYIVRFMKYIFFIGAMILILLIFKKIILFLVGTTP